MESNLYTIQKNDVTWKILLTSLDYTQQGCALTVIFSLLTVPSENILCHFVGFKEKSGNMAVRHVTILNYKMSGLINPSTNRISLSSNENLILISGTPSNHVGNLLSQRSPHLFWNKFSMSHPPLPRWYVHLPHIWMAFTIVMSLSWEY